MDLRLIARDRVFSTRDAARLGLDKNALSRLVRTGRCVRLTSGWYATVEEAPVGAELHRLKAIALGRQFRARAALSHHSSLLVAELPTYAADLDTVHLTMLVPAVGGVASARPGLAIHRPAGNLRIPSPDVHDPYCPRTVPVAHAAVQAGLLAGPEAFLVPADAALRASRTTSGQIAQAVGQFATHTGIGPVRAALPFVEPRHESPGESRTAFLLRALGLDAEPQVDLVVDGHRYRADFRIRGTRVLVEFDGAMKYQDHQSLFAEKQREDALRRAGWVVVRVVWADLADPDRVRQRMRRALSLAS